MTIFHKNIINIDVARSLKFNLSCNILLVHYYVSTIFGVVLLQQTLSMHMRGAIISLLHRVATASVNGYTFNIAQVNVFIKVILRRQRSIVLFCSRPIMIWNSAFCLNTIILSIQIHFYSMMSHLDTISSSYAL